jgi:hypothetical protein
LNCKLALFVENFTTDEDDEDGLYETCGLAEAVDDERGGE